METVEAIYENGKIKFLEKKPPRKKYRVLVTFLEEIDRESKQTMSWKEFLGKWEGFLGDAVQYFSALTAKLDILLTRHKKDLKQAKDIQVLTPAEFVAQFIDIEPETGNSTE